MCIFENVPSTVQQLSALPGWLQAIMVLTPVVLGTIANNQRADKRKAQRLNVPASVAQSKRSVKK